MIDSIYCVALRRQVCPPLRILLPEREGIGDPLPWTLRRGQRLLQEEAWVALVPSPWWLR